MSHSTHTTSIELLGHENMGVAFGISFLSHPQAEILGHDNHPLGTQHHEITSVFDVISPTKARRWFDSRTSPGSNFNSSRAAVAADLGGA